MIRSFFTTTILIMALGLFIAAMVQSITAPSSAHIRYQGQTVNFSAV